MNKTNVKQEHYDVPRREKQPIEMTLLGMTDAEFEGYCIENVMKYILRYKHKGRPYDLIKALEYIDLLMRAILDDEEDE